MGRYLVNGIAINKMDIIDLNTIKGIISTNIITSTIGIITTINMGIISAKIGINGIIDIGGMGGITPKPPIFYTHAQHDMDIIDFIDDTIDTHDTHTTGGTGGTHGTSYNSNG
jgi:hypothetical protein